MSNSLTCGKCNKTFTEKRYLTRHIKNKTCEKTFSCTKCGETFANRRNRDNHMRRKNPCVPTEVPVLDPSNSDNKCKFCGNTYASPYSLRRHIRNCPMRNNQEAMFQMLFEQNQKIMKQNEIIINQQNQPIQHTVNQTVNNTVVNNNLYLNVTICSFGEEDLTKLDQTTVLKLIKEHAKDFMPKMIEHIHANPDHPEYHNVFYDPKRQKALVFTQNKDEQMTWQIEEIETVSDMLANKIKDHMKPGTSPYYDLLVGKKDYDGANKVIDISNKNWDVSEILEETKSALTKVTKNEGFLEKVKVLE